MGSQLKQRALSFGVTLKSKFDCVFLIMCAFNFCGCGCLNDVDTVVGKYTLKSFGDVGTYWSPAWFPMYSANDVKLRVDRKQGVVFFEYQMGETSVVEQWRIKNVLHGPVDECEE